MEDLKREKITNWILKQKKSDLLELAELIDEYLNNGFWVHEVHPDKMREKMRGHFYSNEKYEKHSNWM